MEADKKKKQFFLQILLHSLLPVFILSSSNRLCFLTELIYKEVLDWEERTKNGVIRGQPASIG